MKPPSPRGSLGEQLFAYLRCDAGNGAPRVPDPQATDCLEDAQLSLWALYALHYRGFVDVPPEREWDPDLIALRRSLEAELEGRLRDRFAGHRCDGDFSTALLEFIDRQRGPSLSTYLKRDGTVDQVRQFLRFRSVHHVHEGDPVAWIVPRLPDSARAALAELRCSGRAGSIANLLHASRFAAALASAGVDPCSDATLDQVPLEVLEQCNAWSLFALHRRLTAAAAGHLAAVGVRAPASSRRMARALEGLELPGPLVAYYADVAEDDAVRERLAVGRICGALVAERPALAGEVFFGAFTCLDLEQRLATHLLTTWGRD